MTLLSPDTEVSDTDIKDDPLCEVDHEHDCLVFAGWYYKSMCDKDKGYACEAAHLQFEEWANMGSVVCEYCGAQGRDHWKWTPVGS